jgi:hypothetical protein
MSIHRPRLAWLPLAQILLAAILLAVGLSPMYGPGVRNQIVVHPRPAQVVQRPYTFPHGGRTLFPNYRLIALYGTPDEPALGALGQQPVEASVVRAKGLAEQYQPLMSEHTLPALEIITTVASASPTPNGSYSYAIDLSKVALWVAAAKQSGVYSQPKTKPA